MLSESALMTSLGPQCWACRSRRVRCDSGLPSCSKCALKGWKCPGYSTAKPLRWRHQILQSQPAQSALVLKYPPSNWCFDDNEVAPSHVISETVAYYNTTIAPDLSAAYNRMAYVITKSAWLSMNLVQRHLVVCIVSLHRAVQQPGDVKDHLKPFHHHQACAAHLLSNQIASISAKNPDASLINQMCLFLSSQLQESAYGSWRSHLKGAQAILRIWGPESLIEACNFEYYNFLVVDVYGTTTSPSNMLSKSTIPQHISYLDLLIRLKLDTTTTLVPVPEDVLIVTIAANILRASRLGHDGLPTSTLEKLGISSSGLLERLQSFDPQIWAMKHRNDVESWVSLAICFQAATALYIILEETGFTNESHTELYNQLISSIHDLFDRRNSGGTHFKFILWPMVIAGIGASSRLDRSEIDYLCEKLETMTLVLGALAMRDAAVFLNKVRLQFEDQRASQLNGAGFSMDWNQVCQDSPLFLM